MFDFEKLDVYQVVKEQNNKVLTFLKKNSDVDPLLAERWKNASLNSVLNLAEGTGRKSTTEKKEFLAAARGNIFESATILQIIRDLGQIDEMTYQDYYDGYEKASKMLLGMFRSYNKREQQHQRQEENYNM